MSQSGRIVEIVKSWEGGGLLGLIRRHGPRIPKPSKNEDLYLIRDMDEGEPRLERISPGTTGPGTLPKHAALARIRTDTQTLSCPFAGILKDKSGHKWDVLFAGTWSIVEPRRFLREHAMKAMGAGSSLSAEAMTSWMIKTLRHHVADAVAKHTIEDLREKDTLPHRWWEDHLRQWLEFCGIDIALSSVRWESADAQRAEIEQRRREDMQRLEEQRRHEREAELRESQERTHYETTRAHLEADRQISEAEREHQLRILEERHRQEALQARLQLEQSRWTHEQAQLEHELKMARLRQDIDAAQHAEQRESVAQRQHTQLMQKLNAAQQAFQHVSAMKEPLLVEMNNRDPLIAHQAAERLTSPEFNLSPEALEAMGYAVAPQAFISRLQARQAANRHEVTLTMKELQTRDIGTQQVRVNSLPIGSSLQFEMTSTLPGYVTLINIGTSGRVWLQVPNPFVAPKLAQIPANVSLTVPGPQLLPWEAIGGYYENGPAGWEHMAVTVTDVPIVDEKYMSLATPESPFIDLTSDAAAELAASLEDPAVGDYAIGLLSFLVQ